MSQSLKPWEADRSTGRRWYIDERHHTDHRFLGLNGWPELALDNLKEISF